MTIEELVAACSPWDGGAFDPGSHIFAVNRLRVLPADEVIGGLWAYRRSLQPGPDRFLEGTRLQLLVRLLFVPVDDRVRWSPPRVGAPVDGPEPDVLPTFPLRLARDVPLLAVRTVVVGGHPEDPGDSIAFAEEACLLRDTPLRPPDDPLGLDDGRPMIRGQLLRLVRPVYPVDGLDDGSAVMALGHDTAWAAHRAAFGRLGARWDPTLDRYVLGT